jgi:hypothetical protein
MCSRDLTIRIIVEPGPVWVQQEPKLNSTEFRYKPERLRLWLVNPKSLRQNERRSFRVELSVDARCVVDLEPYIESFAFVESVSVTCALMAWFRVHEKRVGNKNVAEKRNSDAARLTRTSGWQGTRKCIAILSPIC